MRPLTIFFFSIFLFSRAFAQDKFGPGFYVTNTSDTVRGYIEFKGDYDQGFEFRSQLKSSSQSLSMDRVKSFGFTSGNGYDRVENINTKDLPSTPIVVKVVVSGEVNLVMYHGRYIIGSDQRGRFMLVQEKTASSSQALKNYQTNTGIFNILLQDCPAAKEEAQKVTIDEEKLIELLKLYHTCRALPYREFPSTELKRTNHLGFFAGQTISNLSFGAPSTFVNESYLYNSDFAASSQPTFGITALFGGKGPSSKLSIQSELVYTKANFNASYTYAGNVGGYDINQTSVTTVDYSRLSLLAGLRITGRSNTLNPYFSFGLAAQRFLSLNASVHQTTKLNTSVEVKDTDLGMSKSSFAVWAGAGIKKKTSGNKALFLEVNYENSFVSNSGKITALAVRLGFMF